MASNFPVQDAPPVVRDDEEAEQHSEGQDRHREEVHRSDNFPVVAEEGRPSLCRLWTPWRFAYPSHYSSFRNIESEHIKFAMNVRRVPGMVFPNHTEYKLA